MPDNKGDYEYDYEHKHENEYEHGITLIRP
jgi:hypothetical protein